MSRWGIISTGRIAKSFAEALNFLPDADIVAVASRNQANADEFAQAYQIPTAYASYEALVQDPNVEIVYIGTPHVFHYENMLLALHAGKHVLCEKAFTINARQAEECIELARAKGLFLMEAVWMRFIPAIVQLRQWLAEGRIGEILSLRADFNVFLAPDPLGRIYNRALGGGALLDVGVYPFSFASMVLGFPEKVQHSVVMGETGVDEQESFLFTYVDGKTALLSAGINAYTPNEALIKGTKGYIRVHTPFHHPTQMSIGVGKDAPITYDFPYESTGLNYEAAEVQACIKAGLIESAIMPLADSLHNLQLMDRLREDWGLVYPDEE